MNSKSQIEYYINIEQLNFDLSAHTIIALKDNDKDQWEF